MVIVQLYFMITFRVIVLNAITANSPLPLEVLFENIEVHLSSQRWRKGEPPVYVISCGSQIIG